MINSTLFAQLAANNKHNRQNETAQWYDYYKTVLENVGWTVQSFEYVGVGSSSILDPNHRCSRACS